jgi:peptide/nickel transport system ATP-binding protein
MLKVARAMTAPLLEVRGLGKTFRLPKHSLFEKPRDLVALKPLSFTLQHGKSLGIVGESGSGKTTLAKLVMALETPTQGDVIFNGRNIHSLSSADLRAARKGFQMVFQDPFGSLDPRQQIAAIVCEPLQADATIEKARYSSLAQEALSEVGLRQADLYKYPHEFSGGQRQRIAIARALITRPALIVADEPVSALDVSVQAQVLNLMQDLQDKLGISYLLISHDLAVVDLICDDIIVLHEGIAVEMGSADQVLSAPQHPYTKALLDAVPGQ